MIEIFKCGFDRIDLSLCADYMAWLPMQINVSPGAMNGNMNPISFLISNLFDLIDNLSVMNCPVLQPR